MSAPIRQLSLSQIPVFLLNSRLGLFSAALHRRAPLLPKLRGHFAEFLNKGSPVRLRILSSPTCVGFRYGHCRLPSSFSRQREIMCFPTLLRSRLCSAYRVTYLTITQPRSLTGLTITRLALSFCVTASSLQWCRNLHLLSIGYDFRPHLRPRLTLGG